MTGLTGQLACVPSLSLSWLHMVQQLLALAASPDDATAELRSLNPAGEPCTASLPLQTLVQMQHPHASAFHTVCFAREEKATIKHRITLPYSV